MCGNHQPLASAQALPMALDVSTGFTTPRLAVMQPLSCSSFRCPTGRRARWSKHVVRAMSTPLKNV